MKAEHEERLLLDLGTPLPTSHRGLYILVVEDDPNMAQVIALRLRDCGHRVQIAPDGLSACQAARTHPPDVVLLDLALPGMDGWEVARRLQEPTWAKRPLLIALTGYGGEEARRRSREAGIDLHLVKPLDTLLLRGVLKKFCRIILPSEDGRTRARFPGPGANI